MLEKKLSRRTLIKGAVALAAVTTGCGGSDESIVAGGGEQFNEEQLVYTSHFGSASHNCGGACGLQMHVTSSGRVARILSDDKRPDQKFIDGGADDLQIRACVRCRSKTTWFSRSDRLLYPLRQDGERGDLSGFVRITWEQAFREIGQKVNTIKDKYGTESMFPHYSSADGSAIPNGARMPFCMLHAISNPDVAPDDAVRDSFNPYKFDYSFVNHMYIWNFFCGGGYGTVSVFQAGNSRQDLVNAEFVLLWGHNICENIWGTNNMYYLTMAKEKNGDDMPIWAVDQRYSRTANSLADRVLTPVAGTDGAVILAMLYHLLKKEVDDGIRGNYLKFDEIKKYVFGFFDEPEPVSYWDVNNETVGGVTKMKHGYGTPVGGSLSAYILGSEDWLVNDGTPGKENLPNLAPSIYPADIGYNTTELWGKYAPIYGQGAKTPEWAEKISGVPAAAIRTLAEMVATRKTTMLVGGSLQRNTEGEQLSWLLYGMMAITLNFGAPGQGTGFMTGKTGTPNVNPFRIPGHAIVQDPKYFKKLYKARYDDDKISFPGVVAPINKYGLPMAAWIDIVDHSNVTDAQLTNDPTLPKYRCTGSTYGDPQVANGAPIKFVMNLGGNALINQAGDAKKCAAIMTDRTKCELVVSNDPFMSPSAQYADYVLPVALPFERSQITAPWVGMGETYIYTREVLKRPGEVKSDYEIICGIAEACSPDSGKFLSADYKTLDEVIQYNLDRTAEAMPEASWENFRNKGIISFPSGVTKLAFQAFRENPTGSPISTSGNANTPGATATGRFEVFSRLIVEDYEAQGFNSIDTNRNLVNGSFATISTAAGDEGYGRFVYPIPMYIPLVEGSHACDHEDGFPDYPAADASGATRHHDPLGLDKDYPFRLISWHMMYRSHSTINNNAYANELYKLGDDGKAAFNDDRLKDTNDIWMDGVYEPVWVNKSQALEDGFSQGDVILMSSPLGTIKVSLMLSESVQPYVAMIGEGGWSCMKNGVDIGGNPNTLISLRRSRINRGNALSNDTRVNLQHLHTYEVK